MNGGKIVLTGSSGLIGSAVSVLLTARGYTVVPVDLRDPVEPRDIGDVDTMRRLCSDAVGMVHLAAVSRVVHGERNPVLCRKVNVEDTRALLQSALASPSHPWFVYASSREVYGHQAGFPVGEDTPLAPINVYGRSKAEAELLTGEARGAGLSTAIVRFSGVYGAIGDHPDRVVPAFVRAAIAGGTLRVEGTACAFDFTHLEDVAGGLLAVVEQLTAGETRLPPVHFVSGKRTTLLELARAANATAGNRGQIVTAAPRGFDVHEFVGDPERARSLLGWSAGIGLEEGLARYAGLFEAKIETGVRVSP